MVGLFTIIIKVIVCTWKFVKKEAFVLKTILTVIYKETELHAKQFIHVHWVELGCGGEKIRGIPHICIGGLVAEVTT